MGLAAVCVLLMANTLFETYIVLAQTSRNILSSSTIFYNRLRLLEKHIGQV